MTLRQALRETIIDRAQAMAPHMKRWVLGLKVDAYRAAKEDYRFMSPTLAARRAAGLVTSRSYVEFAHGWDEMAHRIFDATPVAPQRPEPRSPMGEWQGFRFVEIKELPSGHMGFVTDGRDVTDWSRDPSAGSIELNDHPHGFWNQPQIGDSQGGFPLSAQDVGLLRKVLSDGAVSLGNDLTFSLYGDDAPLCMIHPGMAHFLMLTPRERWQIDSRVQRMARRGYTPEFIYQHRYG